LGNEENKYLAPDWDRTNKPSDVHKQFLKEEIMEELMKKVQDLVKQKVQEISRHHK
jgi:hypothetical protein